MGFALNGGAMKASLRLLLYNTYLVEYGIFQSSHQKCASNRAVSSAVEHCLHTAGVTSSKLVPPTKNIFKFFKYIAAKAALGLFAKVVGDCCLATLGLISSASTVDPVWSEVSD